MFVTTGINMLALVVAAAVFVAVNNTAMAVVFVVHTVLGGRMYNTFVIFLFILLVDNSTHDTNSGQADQQTVKIVFGHCSWWRHRCSSN